MNWRDLLPGDVYVLKMKNTPFKLVISMPITGKYMRASWFALSRGMIVKDGNQIPEISNYIIFRNGKRIV